MLGSFGLDDEKREARMISINWISAVTQTPARGVDGLFPPKSALQGVSYSRATLEQFHEAISRWLKGPDRRKNAMIGYVNPHVFNLARKHAAVRSFLEKADIVTVDGVGFSIALWLLRGVRQPRTVMTPLFDSILDDTSFPAERAVLIGGAGEAPRKSASAISRRSPRIKVTAFADGYQPFSRYHELLRSHDDADVVLVAMGSPRSEEYMLEASPLFPEKLFWNIGGGTLNYYAGVLRRPPTIVSRLCLQWVWRILFERGIAPRYFLGIPKFVWNVLSKKHNQETYGKSL